MSRDGEDGSDYSTPRRLFQNPLVSLACGGGGFLLSSPSTSRLFWSRIRIAGSRLRHAPVLFSHSEMGNTTSVKTEASDSAEQPAAPAPAPEAKPKKKICCACPDTKKLRDDCIVQNGEDACGKFIEAHLQCLRAEGFNV